MKRVIINNRLEGRFRPKYYSFLGTNCPSNRLLNETSNINNKIVAPNDYLNETSNIWDDYVTPKGYLIETINNKYSFGGTISSKILLVSFK